MAKTYLNPALEQMLKRVPQASDSEGNQALREVLQEVALAGLVRRGFFGKAAFYGGTCLRIFQQLPRFSEDLDFSLLQPDPDFALQPYLRGLAEEFAALGIQVEIREKTKNNSNCHRVCLSQAQHHDGAAVLCRFCLREDQAGGRH